MLRSEQRLDEMCRKMEKAMQSYEESRAAEKKDATDSEAKVERKEEKKASTDMNDVEALRAELAQLKKEMQELKVKEPERSNKGRKVERLFEDEEEILKQLADNVAKEFLALQNELAGDESGTLIQLHERDIEALNKLAKSLKNTRGLNWFFAVMATGSYITRAATGSFGNGWVGIGGAIFQGIFTLAEYQTKNEAEEIYAKALVTVEKAYERFKRFAEAALKFHEAVNHYKFKNYSLQMMPEKFVKYCQKSGSLELQKVVPHGQMFKTVVTVACEVGLVYQGLQLLPAAVVKDFVTSPYVGAVADGLLSIGSIAGGLCGTKSKELSSITSHVDELKTQVDIMKSMV